MTTTAAWQKQHFKENDNYFSTIIRMIFHISISSILTASARSRSLRLSTFHAFKHFDRELNREKNNKMCCANIN